MFFHMKKKKTLFYTLQRPKNDGNGNGSLMASIVIMLDKCTALHVFGKGSVCAERYKKDILVLKESKVTV